MLNFENSTWRVASILQIVIALYFSQNNPVMMKL